MACRASSERRGSARIEPRAVFHRVLDPGRGDRVVDDRIGADEQHHIRLHHVHHRVGHRARSDAFESAATLDAWHSRVQWSARCSSRSRCARASGTGTLPRWSLWPIRSASASSPCVSRIRRSESLASASSPRPTWPRGTPIADWPDRPRSPPISAPRARGSAASSSVRMPDIVEAEAALHAQPLVVGRTVAALHPHDRVVMHVVGQLAAHAAVRAERRHLSIGARR